MVRIEAMAMVVLALMSSCAFAAEQNSGSSDALMQPGELQRADQWLQEHGLNAYGDSNTIAYAGGTPLFDERTGRSKSRVQHLLEKFPHRPWNGNSTSATGGNVRQSSRLYAVASAFRRRMRQLFQRQAGNDGSSMQ